MGRILSFSLIIILAAYGLFISRHSNKGETLYPLKILGEEIEYALTPTVEGKASIKLDRLADQNTELRQNVNQDDLDKAIDNSEKFQETINEIKQDIGKAKDEGKNTDNLNQELTANIDNHLCILAEALSKASPEKQEQIQQFIKQLASQ